MRKIMYTLIILNNLEKFKGAYMWGIVLRLYGTEIGDADVWNKVLACIAAHKEIPILKCRVRQYAYNLVKYNSFQYIIPQIWEIFFC